MVAFINMFQQQPVAHDNQWAQQRADDMKTQQIAWLLQAQSMYAVKTPRYEVKRLAFQKHNSTWPWSIKLPSFDLEKYRLTTNQWKDQ